MSQRDRDRLVVLKKAQKKLITQRQAGEELRLTERQIGRLLAKLRDTGDKTVIHGLRGRRSNRRLDEERRCAFSRRMSTGAFGRHWQASIWPANTISGSVAKAFVS